MKLNEYPRAVKGRRNIYLGAVPSYTEPLQDCSFLDVREVCPAFTEGDITVVSGRAWIGGRLYQQTHVHKRDPEIIFSVEAVTVFVYWDPIKDQVIHRELLPNEMVLVPPGLVHTLFNPGTTPSAHVGLKAQRVGVGGSDRIPGHLLPTQVLNPNFLEAINRSAKAEFINFSDGVNLHKKGIPVSIQMIDDRNLHLTHKPNRKALLFLYEGSIVIEQNGNYSILEEPGELYNLSQNTTIVGSNNFRGVWINFF